MSSVMNNAVTEAKNGGRAHVGEPIYMSGHANQAGTGALSGYRALRMLPR